MTCGNGTRVLRLAAHETIRLDDARGTTLRVPRGTLWITLENDTRDIVLGAGEAFTIDRGGLTLAEAQRSTTVWVQPRHDAAVRGAAFAAALARRVARWLASVGASIPPRRWAPYV